MTIRTDATRLKLRPADPRRHRAVAPRQGQVLTDADLEQQSALTLTRIESATADMLGSPGRLLVPGGSAAFLITAAATPAACGIGMGQGYLGGWQLDNAGPCTLATQPHPRNDTSPVAPVAIALKALVRHIDPVEEPAWADKGLGDAQASGRTLTDWQVFPFAPAGGFGAAPDCAGIATNADWQKLIAPSTGTLTVIPDTAPPAGNPCSLTPQGGFSRGENLLYRIEVHGGIKRADMPDADGARFGLEGLRIKMSRGNASVLVKITDTNGTDITVTPPALDPLNWFAPGLHAEFVSRHDDLSPPDPAVAERLFRVSFADDTRITLDPAAALLAAAVKGQEGWFLRLWHGFAGLTAPGTVAVDTTGHPGQSQDIDLGDGLKVRLGGATAAVFRRGDYWTFAARADGSIDWPPGAAETPHGPEIRYAPLAVVKPPATSPTADDCRIPFASLTDRTLLYRGGDGQEIPQPIPVTPGFATLPVQLRVAVMRGRLAVAGATVRWSAPPGAAPSRINGQTVGGGAFVDLPASGPEGLSQVTWAIDQTMASGPHRVQAELLSATGTPEPHALIFQASFRTARQTSYEPGQCAVLSGATNVQQALDTLCGHLGNPEPETLRLTSIRLAGKTPGITDLLKEKLILNGASVPHDAFDEAIGIGISDGPLGLKAPSFDPIVEVELDLPYPITDPDRLYWLEASAPRGRSPLSGPFGFQRVRLDGGVEAIKENGPFESGLLWKPSRQARAFLATLPQHLGGQLVLDDKVAGQWKGPRFDQLLCRLRVRSAHVWVGEGEKRRYLNAEHLGTAEGQTDRELLVGERDPQRAADLEMYFYLKLPG